MTPNDLFDLTGKVALVTGGSSGIGRMAAEGLVAAGARVLIASRKADACGAVAAELNGMDYSGSAEGFAGDVSTEAGIDALVAEVNKRTDKLHILMNNAGRTWGAAIGEHPYQAWEKLLSLNVTGMFHLTQQLLPLLKAASTPQDPARVVNVGSVMGDIPKGTQTYSYAVSKGAVHHMTRVLSNDLAPEGITVNAIAPGPFVSKMTAFAIGTEEGQKKSAEGVPLGRVGCPEDIAGALQYLCGRGGSYVSGAILPLSGGMQSNAPGSLFNEDL
ncbi:Rhamnolipids biosynthesis 3-oxoacyl-[acyl-carrier-protein] reductase [Thalassovita gelatinovora]|uniref:Rhamnolipids biosynthesis 3-oxoacyl-[acyl-carrier-protein] reductase n=1 Tax=Thalassovita gelatinovora TaxID=53501 RepID=A0A0P1FB30_THAGE|nr:SDR family NAD(P)-dependent oxidoreductase [Thalassovita gelatinovora]QIZ80761.1 SDR family NAD(P)-dependent oxidoreductase [Thalassovita gelatinovora]CUH65415.1 Rhamnolipids biosynthesis 3-oxoacyl-[acyl-carrier-protein] reductase [Thalassovita gelatinovora]SEQ90723.1 NAD(P)-dependent dehydrogenase, short-chain alcohol dehydrogenase family [Thalassovita gelatinovora]